MTLNRRQFLRGSLLAVACSREDAPRPAPAASGYETLELRYQGNNGIVTPAELAEDLGYLAPVRLSFIGSTISGPHSVQAVVTGDTDFGGAFKVNVDNIGTKLAWKLPSPPQPPGSTTAIARGNLGPAGNFGIDFVPPKGIGVLIDAGPVKGGGFFYLDPEHRTYAGVIEASLALCGKGVQIKAAGLLRETDESWDFVLILSAEFEPAIEIFLGLTLNGVGGMLGINVAVSVEKLRAALHDGSLGRLLFPKDPVANAPAIIATMIAVFPHRQGGGGQIRSSHAVDAIATPATGSARAVIHSVRVAAWPSSAGMAPA